MKKQYSIQVLLILTTLLILSPLVIVDSLNDNIGICSKCVKGYGLDVSSRYPNRYLEEALKKHVLRYLKEEFPSIYQFILEHNLSNPEITVYDIFNYVFGYSRYVLYSVEWSVERDYTIRVEVFTNGTEHVIVTLQVFMINYILDHGKEMVVDALNKSIDRLRREILGFIEKYGLNYTVFNNSGTGVDEHYSIHFRDTPLMLLREECILLNYDVSLYYSVEDKNSYFTYRNYLRLFNTIKGSLTYISSPRIKLSDAVNIAYSEARIPKSAELGDHTIYYIVLSNTVIPVYMLGFYDREAEAEYGVVINGVNGEVLCMGSYRYRPPLEGFNLLLPILIAAMVAITMGVYIVKNMKQTRKTIKVTI